MNRTLCRKKIFAEVTKLSILSLRDHPGLSGWVLNTMASGGGGKVMMEVT